MNLNSIEKSLLKLFSVPDLKGKPLFRLGEILKGEVLEKAENMLLVDLGEKGIVKAFSDLDIAGGNILLKVISTKPEVVLKVFNKHENHILDFIKDLDNDKSVKEALKNVKSHIKDKIFIFEKDLSKPELLKSKIIRLPENIGFDFEKSILENNVNKESLKFNLLESHKTSSSELLNFINNNQKLNNDFQMIFPLFFQETEMKKGAVLFKKKEGGAKEQKSFSIVIFLELMENRQLQVNITAIKKELSLSFLSNSSFFIKILKKDFKNLADALEGMGFKILSYNFKTVESLDNNEEMLNLLLENNNLNIIDIKT